MADTPHPPRLGATPGRATTAWVCDPLHMLVTSDPVAELDEALRQLRRQQQRARAHHDDAAIARLQAWIDRRLEERHALSAPYAESSQ